MRTFSGGSATLALPSLGPSLIDLPLQLVVNRPDLHELFLEFAAQVFNSTSDTNTKADFSYLGRSQYPPITSGLCRMIYDGWLTELVSSTYTETARNTAAFDLLVPSSFPNATYTPTINRRAVGPDTVPEVTVKTDTVTSSVKVGSMVTISLYETTTVTLYRLTVGGESVSEITSPAALISLIQQALLFRPGSRVYVLIGIYHFVIWCFSTKVDTLGQLDPLIIDYIHQELTNHHSALKQKDDTVLNPPFDLSSAFKPEFSLREFTLHFQNFVSFMKFDDPASPTIPPFPSRSTDQKKAVNAAVCSFIRQARTLLAEVVHKEVIELSAQIDLGLSRDYKQTKITAIGNGDESYGFFGKRNFGILFFQYELRCVASTDDFLTDPDIIKNTLTETLLKYLGVQKAVELEEDDATSIFLAPVGMDQNFVDLYGGAKDSKRLHALIPHIEAKLFGIDGRSHLVDTLYAVENGTCRFKTDGTAGIYNPSDSSLSADPATCTSLTITTNTNIKEGETAVISDPNRRILEELAFFVMPNRVAAVPPSAQATAHWLLDDNEFFDATKIADLFEESSGTYPNLDAVLAELVFQGEFEVSATLRGDGIGEILDPREASLTWKNVVKASRQADLPKFKTKVTKNTQERHARGTMSYYRNGDYRLLKFDVVGFASPVRCTWEAKSFATKMAEKVGDYVKDLDDKGGPWYNGALSSFRAFGLLKGMIKALTNRAIAAGVTSSSPYILQTLNDFLQDKARVRIKTRNNQWVLKGTEELFIDNDIYTYVTS
jgi:hypothetical protein